MLKNSQLIKNVSLQTEPKEVLCFISSEKYFGLTIFSFYKENHARHRHPKVQDNLIIKKTNSLKKKF